MKTGIEVI